MTPQNAVKLKKRLLIGLPYGLSVRFALMGLPMALGMLSLVVVYLLHRFWGTDGDRKLVVPLFVPVVFTFGSATIALSHV